MNKKLTALILAMAVASAFCLSACGGDNKIKASSSAPESSVTSETASSENGIPKEGDMYKGKKVGSVEKVPDCDDDKHGVIYIYDENEELIEAVKY